MGERDREREGEERIVEIFFYHFDLIHYRYKLVRAIKWVDEVN